MFFDITTKCTTATDVVKHDENVAADAKVFVYYRDREWQNWSKIRLIHSWFEFLITEKKVNFSFKFELESLLKSFFSRASSMIDLSLNLCSVMTGDRDNPVYVLIYLFETHVRRRLLSSGLYVKRASLSAESGCTQDRQP